MGNRYNNKTIFRNQSESYESILEQRQVPYIRQYGTPQLESPGASDRADLLRKRLTTEREQFEHISAFYSETQDE